jgi:hypothetical protein
VHWWPFLIKSEARKFQKNLAITLDLIRFARNKLIHDAIQPVPSNISKHISTSLEYHIFVWKKHSLDSSVFG